jgi:hypothetical protein
MQITIDTNNLSEMDIAMLGFLAEQGEAAPAEDVAEETPAPAKKAAAKPEPKKAAAKPEPEPEPEETTDGPTMSDAVAAATKLVSNGGAATVKAALAAVGSKRVSEIEEKDIQAFLDALSAEL